MADVTAALMRIEGKLMTGDDGVPIVMSDSHETEAARWRMEAVDWRETVREVYDRLHLSPHGLFGTGEGLSAELIGLIEERHPGYFMPVRR